jgi:hypothetical protein
MRFSRILVFFFTAVVSFSNHAAEPGLLTVSGFGTTDLTIIKIKAQATMMARRAAIVDAQRNLSEQLKGVRLTGGTTMEEYEISSDIVATRVKSLLAGAFEYDQIITDGEQSVSVEVVMAICLNNLPEVCQNRMTLQQVENFIQSLQPSGAQ